MLLGILMLAQTMTAQAQVKDLYDKFKDKNETKKDGEEKKEAKKSPLHNFFDQFQKNDENKNTSSNTTSTTSTTVIHNHYYYDYYGAPTYQPRTIYYAPPVDNSRSVSFSQIKDDLLLAYQSQDADLLALYLSPSDKIFVEFPDETPVYLERESFYIRTRELFQEIKTKSAEILLDRDQGNSGLIKIRHVYTRGNITRTDDIAFFLQHDGDTWTLTQLRYSFPSAHYAKSNVPRSLAIADMEAGGKSISFMMSDAKETQQKDASLNLGIFDYGGIFIKHWEVTENWDATQPQLGDLRMMLTDFGVRGQFVKAETHKFSLAMEVLGKWIRFNPPPAVRAQNPRIQSLGIGIALAGFIPAGKYVSFFGRVEAASFTKGVKVMEYEIGTGLHLHKNVTLLLSRKGLDFSSDVLTSNRAGIEIQF